MSKWEYRVLCPMSDYDKSPRRPDDSACSKYTQERWLHLKLNGMGVKGWELVCCNGGIYTFKRPRQKVEGQ